MVNESTAYLGHILKKFVTFANKFVTLRYPFMSMFFRASICFNSAVLSMFSHEIVCLIFKYLKTASVSTKVCLLEPASKICVSIKATNNI